MRLLLAFALVALMTRGALADDTLNAEARAFNNSPASTTKPCMTMSHLLSVAGDPHFGGTLDYKIKVNLDLATSAKQCLNRVGDEDGDTTAYAINQDLAARFPLVVAAGICNWLGQHVTPSTKSDLRQEYARVCEP
jgi:hypothetical protein